jgi:hypothetical protein
VASESILEDLLTMLLGLRDSLPGLVEDFDVGGVGVLSSHSSCNVRALGLRCQSLFEAIKTN